MIESQSWMRLQRNLFPIIASAGYYLLNIFCVLATVHFLIHKL